MPAADTPIKPFHIHQFAPFHGPARFYRVGVQSE
jgi:hypothetical protein